MKTLQRILIAVFITVYCVFSGGTALAGEVEAVALTWTEDAQTTQTITWQTAEAHSDLYLEYRAADAALASLPHDGPTAVFGLSFARAAAAAHRVWNTDAGAIGVHTVTLRDLRPGTRYVYRIGDGMHWAHSGRFVTEPAQGAFSFLVFGDSQSTDYTVWKHTFENACENHPEARFFVNVGDLVDNGQTYSEWQAWHRAVAAYAGDLPMLPVVGNHETYTPEGSYSMPHFFTAQFALPQNGPEGLKGQVYSFDYGAVHFVVLDSQFGEERAFVPDARKRQKKWLAADLAATDRLWKVVFVHRPLYHNRTKNDKPNGAMAKLAPLFEQYGVDVVFNGHDHVNARTPKLLAGYPSEQGVVYATVGRSGTKTYLKREPKQWNEQFANPLDQPTYTLVRVADGVFTVRVVKQDGAILDEWSLTKDQT